MSVGMDYKRKVYLGFLNCSLLKVYRVLKNNIIMRNKKSVIEVVLDKKAKTIFCEDLGKNLIPDSFYEKMQTN